jgi:hypothetical protein
VTARRIAGEDGRGAIVLVLADGDDGGGNGRKRPAEGRRAPAR